MADYPEKTCSVDRLVRNKKSIKSSIEGQKTQQRRDGVYAYPGETFELDGEAFIITDLSRESLADMNDAAAQAEGYPDLSSYKDLILKMHPGMTWSAEALVWVHHYKKSA
ncbi:MAG: ASCH domain-containing protein [Pseudomonadales bacterium]|nr:ASCH domain-containing protein [Pseudomonadales bacterium]